MTNEQRATITAFISEVLGLDITPPAGLPTESAPRSCETTRGRSLAVGQKTEAIVNGGSIESYKIRTGQKTQTLGAIVPGPRGTAIAKLNGEALKKCGATYLSAILNGLLESDYKIKIT